LALTLEDPIMDMTALEKNLAKDRLMHKSDAQAHKEYIRAGVPLYSDIFVN
jgi:hypothetical protein